MSSVTEMAYRSACETAEFFQSTTQIINEQPIWVSNHLASTDQMRAFSDKVFGLINGSRHLISSPVQLDPVDDEHLTTIDFEVSVLAKTLEDNLMTARYYKIFKSIVLEPLEIIRVVEPHTHPIQVVLSQHLTDIEKRLNEDGWIAKHLDTPDKVRIFASSFYQLLKMNVEYLVGSTIGKEERPQAIINRISQIMNDNGHGDVFDLEVMKMLPELESLGKTVKMEKVSRMIPDMECDMEKLHARLNELKIRRGNLDENGETLDVEEKNLTRLIEFHKVGYHMLKAEVDHSS